MADRYERINELSKGVLGTVYLAEDTMLQRQVMFRHIEHNGGSDQESRDDSWRKEFAQYAGKIGAMQHPNMLAIYDIAVKDNDAHVVTQFIEGETLAERLERGALGQIGVYRMAHDMLEVIHAAHEADVFHGALHTESIRRIHRASGGHRYLLVDLGLNKLTSLVQGEKVKVADPVLMAPELYDNDKEPDAKADLFMLGQLCYTALVGGHPFSDKSSEECVAAYNGQGVPALEQYVEGLDPHFSAWVMSLIDGDPEKRPVDSGEAMVKLYAIQLAESEPNVPGKTHAVVAQYVAPASEPNILTSSHPLQMATTASVNIEAAPTAATGHVAVGGVPSVDSVVKEKKGKTAIIYVVSGLVAALMIGIMVVAFRGDEEDEKSEVGTAEAIEENAKKGEHLISIGKEVEVNADGQPPVTVDLENSKTLDWIVGTGIPIASNYREKENGDYIHSVNSVVADKELRLQSVPVRFKLRNETLLPRSGIYKNGKAKRGAGYEIQMRIPSKKVSSITVNLYMIQKGGDIRLEVTRPRDDSREVSIIPFTGPRSVMIPVKIDNPTPGDFYTLKANSETERGKAYMICLSGVLIEEQ